MVVRRSGAFGLFPALAVLLMPGQRTAGLDEPESTGRAERRWVVRGAATGFAEMWSSMAVQAAAEAAIDAWQACCCDVGMWGTVKAPWPGIASTVPLLLLLLLLLAISRVANAFISSAGVDDVYVRDWCCS